MKKLFFLFTALFSLHVVGQTVPATYTADFKLLFASAKKSFETDKTDQGKDISTDDFVKEFGSKTNFQGAQSSRLVMDKDMVMNHHARFDAGTDKEAAKTYLQAFITATKPLLPAKYHENVGVNVKYIDNYSMTLEYDSEVFFEQASKPVVIMGLVQTDGKYWVDIRIMGPSV